LFFFETNVLINFLQKRAIVGAKNANFFAIYSRKWFLKSQHRILILKWKKSLRGLQNSPKM
jgi:hypothetical protein